jgi:hypothetical protein
LFNWRRGGEEYELMKDCGIGKMSMTIPNFINLEHDEPNRKAFVSVEDKEVKKQREMWGT